MIIFTILRIKHHPSNNLVMEKHEQVVIPFYGDSIGYLEILKIDQ
jgi:hypothetical protein